MFFCGLDGNLIRFYSRSSALKLVYVESNLDLQFKDLRVSDDGIIHWDGDAARVYIQIEGQEKFIFFDYACDHGYNFLCCYNREWLIYFLGDYLTDAFAEWWHLEITVRFVSRDPVDLTFGTRIITWFGLEITVKDITRVYTYDEITIFFLHGTRPFTGNVEFFAEQDYYGEEYMMWSPFIDGRDYAQAYRVYILRMEGTEFAYLATRLTNEFLGVPRAALNLETGRNRIIIISSFLYCCCAFGVLIPGSPGRNATIDIQRWFVLFEIYVPSPTSFTSNDDLNTELTALERENASEFKTCKVAQIDRNSRQGALSLLPLVEITEDRELRHSGRNDRSGGAIAKLVKHASLGAVLERPMHRHFAGAKVEHLLERNPSKRRGASGIYAFYFLDCLIQVASISF